MDMVFLNYFIETHKEKLQIHHTNIYDVYKILCISQAVSGFLWLCELCSLP